MNHLLKVRALVCGSRDGFVYVVLQNGVTVLLGKLGAFPNLDFNGFLPLAGGGIAGVDDGLHTANPYPSGLHLSSDN